MSRFRRVAHSVASSYAVLIAAAVYSLASLPMALHYLSRERFGLWTLMASVGGYLSLIDLGMSGSVARLLIDHKDDPQRGAYGSLIKTGWCVLVVQGLLLFLTGFLLTPALATLLKIPPHLQTEFIALMRWQCVVLAVGFMIRIFSHILLAHQRLDISNYSQITALGLNFCLLWLLFELGQGVFSLVWAGLISSLCGAAFTMGACWRLRLFPPPGAWGRTSWIQFKAIFDYGKDMFLVAVGTQLLLASQSLILTRRLGLEVAAAWYAGTRAFNLVSQAVWKFSDMSGPAFSEMIVRGEQARLLDRYKSLVVLTASVSGFAAVVYAMCNTHFVNLLTHHKILWPSANDLLLGVWLIVMAVLHCHNGFILLTKQIRFMRYVYFLEGIVFVIAALLTTGWGGLPALIICSILCSASFRGAYGLWRISRYFQLRVSAVGLGWLGPMARVLVLFSPIAWAITWTTKGLEEPMARFGLHLVLGGAIGGYLLLRFGISQAFQRELLDRAPRGINPLLRWVFVGAGQ